MTQVGVGEIMDQSFTENTEILRQVEGYVTAAMAGNDPAHDDGHVRHLLTPRPGRPACRLRGLRRKLR